METTARSTSKSFSLKNRHIWSDSRYAWFYASIILVAVIIFAIILKMVGIYESMAWRIFNALFILGGFIALVRDYKSHKDYKVTYTNALLLCIRTGFYFALLFLPILAFVLLGYPAEQLTIDKQELYNADAPVLEIVFVNWIETAATIAIASFVAPYFKGFGGAKKMNNEKI